MWRYVISGIFVKCFLTLRLFSERVLPQELLLLDLLQQWGARRPEVSFYLRHCPSWTQGTAKQIHIHTEFIKALSKNYIYIQLLVLNQKKKDLGVLFEENVGKTRYKCCAWGLEVSSGSRSVISQIRWLELHNGRGVTARGQTNAVETPGDILPKQLFDVLAAIKKNFVKPGRRNDPIFPRKLLNQRMSDCVTFVESYRPKHSSAGMYWRHCSAGVFLCLRLVLPTGTGQPHHLLVPVLPLSH